jgi:predicted SAM-dependent methyltransferase
MRYANLGCGARTHPDWINIDIVPQAPGVIAHDLSRGVPLEDASCDVVYHAHLLEHLRRPDALNFMGECRRVLKPGGILRVATPDLERMARLYLDTLEKSGDGSAQRHEWITLEMYDQAVREESGGQMREYLKLRPLPAEGFVLERIGQEGREIIEALQRNPSAPAAAPPSLRERLIDAVRTVFLGQRDRRALRIGRFRLGGEVHQWMYDRYSLARLMTDAGFENPLPRTASSSLITGWSGFNLDTQPDGAVIKPDSMFMEAVRPTGTA